MLEPFDLSFFLFLSSSIFLLCLSPLLYSLTLSISSFFSLFTLITFPSFPLSSLNSSLTPSSFLSPSLPLLADLMYYLFYFRLFYPPELGLCSHLSMFCSFVEHFQLPVCTYELWYINKHALPLSPSLPLSFSLSPSSSLSFL